MSLLPAAPAPRLRRWRWEHPEAGVAALVTLAALALAALALVVHGGGHGGRGHGERLHGQGGLAFLGHWVLMVVAVMLPTVLPVLRETALSARWARRARTVTLLTIAYVAVWAVAGLVVLGFARLVAASGGLDLWAVAVLLGAAGWEVSRPKQRLLRECHRGCLLPPDGREADLGCLVAGLRLGSSCVGACGPAMLVMTPTLHIDGRLAALLAGLAAARRLLRDRPAVRVATAAPLAVGAAIVAGT